MLSVKETAIFVRKLPFLWESVSVLANCMFSARCMMRERYTVKAEMMLE